MTMYSVAYAQKGYVVSDLIDISTLKWICAH